MQCLTDLGGGQFALSSPQPTEYTACVYVLAQPDELTSGAFMLDVEGAQAIAAGIALLWAIGAVFRIVISLLKSKGNQNEVD